MKSLFLTLSKAEHTKMQFVAKTHLLDVSLTNYAVAYVSGRPMFSECVLNHQKNVFTSILHVIVLYGFYLRVRRTPSK